MRKHSITNGYVFVMMIIQLSDGYDNSNGLDLSQSVTSFEGFTSDFIAVM